MFLYKALMLKLIVQGKNIFRNYRQEVQDIRLPSSSFIHQVLINCIDINSWTYQPQSINHLGYKKNQITALDVVQSCSKGGPKKKTQKKKESLLRHWRLGIVNYRKSVKFVGNQPAIHIPCLAPNLHLIPDNCVLWHISNLFTLG